MTGLPPHQQLIRPGRWPVVGEVAPEAPLGPWSVTLCGKGISPRTIQLNEIESLPKVERHIDVHCVTRWSKPSMHFSGVPLLDLIRHALGKSDYPADLRFLSFTAYSERNHSTSLPIESLESLNPIVALAAEGTPLTVEHGGPVRLVVPGKYFYKSLKWLRQIEFLREDRLGYWEANAGYHNGADPWKEQRYIAANLDKRTAARLVSQRNFESQDLLSLDAEGQDLSRLKAAKANLRNGNFRNAMLVEADFENANLSNADFRGSTLRSACFRNADVEGANFSSSDLRGVDFRGASLFGASFAADSDSADSGTNAEQTSVFDGATQFDAGQLDALTLHQREKVENAFRRC